MKFAVFATIAIALVACAQADPLQSCGKKTIDAWTKCGKTLLSGKTCSSHCKQALKLTTSPTCVKALFAEAGAGAVSPKMISKILASFCRSPIAVVMLNRRSRWLLPSRSFPSPLTTTLHPSTHRTCAARTLSMRLPAKG